MRVITQVRAARRALTLALTLAAIAAGSLLVSACGSSATGGSGGSSTPSSAGAGDGGSATVSTTKVPGYGTVLADSKGDPLYLLTADPTGRSSCNGSCAKQWTPLTASGKPTAGPGVTASMLSSFKRADGTQQVLYNGHALYTHPGTSATASAGMASDGGIWYLVSPSGQPIKSTTGSGY